MWWIETPIERPAIKKTQKEEKKEKVFRNNITQVKRKNIP
jgi:hypothetical protein